MRIYGKVRDGVPMVRVVLPDGKTVEGQLMEVMTRADVLKCVESAAWQRNGLRIA